MTEISGMTCSLAPSEHLNPEHPERLDSVSTVIAQLDWRVVDPETGEDVGARQPGELWTRGPSVMLGYWNDPEATSAAVTNGWLRTGDLVKHDEHGYVYIVGRLKELIISGGENIAPAEVEKAAATHPRVEEAHAFGVPDDRFGEVVALAVITTAGPTVDVDDLLDHCARLLARFKVPRYVEIVPDVPRTPTGKVRRHVLRDQWELSRASRGGN